MSYTNKQNNRYGKPVKSKKHDFSRIPSANIPRSVFDRSSQHKTTFDSGLLVPVFVDEALPGDTFHLSTQMLARLSTPIVPIMDNLKLDVHYFSVPCRLLWDNWQAFMGERKNPGDSVDYLVPQYKAWHDGGFTSGSLADYFGMPVGVPNLEVSALPFRAYHLIYNEWFRDQNLCPAADVETDDVTFETQGGNLRRRSKRHDYFTSCLPWPQKGEGVELPLGVPNINWETFQFSDRDGTATGLYTLDGTDLVTGTALEANPPVAYDMAGGFSLSPSSALTINTLRQAFQMQKMLERDARGGSRYVEIIRSHFGVISPDARMQRPEYLGMSSFDVNVNPVLQNSATTDKTPQGNLAAYGVAGGAQHGFSHSFVEHCMIIGIASVRADLTYQQGVPRMFSRRTRFDYYWPSLAHLGEQAVLNKEIYASADGSGWDDVFGYQERFAEYRYKPSMITGKMRSDNPQSLHAWHLAQDFKTVPVLNQEFIEENAPLGRCLAVQDEPQFIADFAFNLNCVRPMPTYSVPGMIDHF